MGYTDKNRQKDFGKAHYLLYKETYAKRGARNREELRAFFEIAKGKPCSGCGGVFHPCVMEFHHRDRSAKAKNIASFRAMSSRLIEEINKCDLLCANCHRMAHFNLGEFGRRTS
jgi:hypothetical protein